MKYLKYLLIILLFTLFICNGCSNKEYYYKINNNELIIVIDNIEYNVGTISTNNYNKKIKKPYDFYKSLYTNYIGNEEQFKQDVIKERLDEGNALLVVTYNINNNKKEELFYRGDNLSFPNVSSKDFIINGWKYNNEYIDESYIVEDDMEIIASINYYVNISVSVIGSGIASINSTKAWKGDNLKLLYTPSFGYKLSSVIYNDNKISLSDDDTFEVIDDSNVNLVVVFEIDKLSLPIMTIDLETSLNNVTQEEYVSGKMSISNTLEKYEFSDLDFLFRGRGNWSWAKEKKGYRIKFDSKQNLFGNCKSKHWAIIASYVDITLLRNKISYEIASNVLDDIYYTTSCVNLEVFINNEYRGIYSLVELPKAEKDKMNIDESYDYVDTGYIVELDAYAINDWQKNPTNAIEGINYFKINGVKYPFSIKSPDPDDYKDETMFKKQVAYIKDYFENMFQAVFDHNIEEFQKYADINSFVDMYILDEIIKNTDVGWQSFYFVKEKSGKIYLTAPWDLEFSCGINRGDQNYTGMYVSEWFDKELATKTASELFINLMQCSEFEQLVIKRFKQVKDNLLKTINKQLDNELLYEDSYNRNYKKFKILGIKLNEENYNVYKLKTWKEHVEYLRNWLINRINWLDNYWNIQ